MTGTVHSTTILVLGLMTLASANADDSVMCPIMPDNQVSKEFYCDYDGKRYYFCTDACVADFRSDPSRFVNLPTVKGFPIPSEKAVAAATPKVEDQSLITSIYSSLHRKVTRRIRRYALDAPIVQIHLAALFLVMFIPFLESRLRKRRGGDMVNNETNQVNPSSGSRLVKFLFQKKRIAWALGVAMLVDALCLASVAAKTKRDLNEVLIGDISLSQDKPQLSDSDQEILRSVHYSTFTDFGFPPRPKKREHDNSLSRVYYRGNDERHSQMFNNGQYRTATFRLNVETMNGSPIDYGTKVDPNDVYLRVSFERAPNTSSGYYTNEYMKKMYLTMKQDRFLGRHTAVEDRTPWYETEKGVIWESRYKLGSGDHAPKEWQMETASPNESRGVVYLVEERQDGTKVQGGRYHFGVIYHLKLADGVVSDASDLYMGTTYRGANFYKYNIKEEDWLSIEPIPEIPSITP